MCSLILSTCEMHNVKIIIFYHAHEKKKVKIAQQQNFMFRPPIVSFSILHQATHIQYRLIEMHHSSGGIVKHEKYHVVQT